MNLMKIVFAAFLMASLGAIQAHPDHGPPLIASCKAEQCTKEEIRLGGIKVVGLLVEMQSIHKSWAAVKAPSAMQNNTDDWTLKFENPKESDKAKRVLFVFLSTDGYLIGSNFTGR